MGPKLSVVLPVYGVEQYLPACLESLRNQTLTDFEVIVVDDGSPDRCGAIAEEWAATDPRFVVTHIPNGGLGPARNHGTALATGEYLTFADSDDLIPPRAYERMVDTLDLTGSDFVAGNAWRFADGMGTVPSWTHRLGFGEDRLRTHITEFHPLLRDRMVWNKVYRRSFWDRHGLAFPPIKYEDYPVTLKAHLVASAVDVLSDKVYMWRNRESGDSITQQLGNPHNAADRVTSAEMVLETLSDATADRQLIDAVHAYFIDIDVVALATALTLATAEDLPEIQHLGRRLARRLAPQKYGPTRLARLIHEALRKGDFDTARALAGWRSSPNKKDLLRQLARPGTLHLVPGVASAIVYRRKPNNPFGARKLRTSLVELAREDDHFMLHTSTLLSPGVVKGARITAQLVGEGTRLPLEIRSTPTPAGFKLISLIPARTARLLRDDPVTVEIAVAKSGLRWRGSVALEVGQLPGPLVDDGRWLTPTAEGGWLGFRALRRAVVAQAVLDVDRLVVTLPDATPGSVVIQRPEPTADLLIPVDGGRAEVAYAAIVDGDPADNPFSGTADRGLFFLPDDEGPGAEPRPLLFLEWPDSVESGDYLFQLQAAPDGAGQLVHTYLPAADRDRFVAEDLSDLVEALRNEG
ncbi:MAG TPA: glycosyltransferase [Arachnia sp.]|nr:glycosyltransferase [Arachnia sp.]HMT85115.1 glycosyltransferase [Arachnia sp.]